MAGKTGSSGGAGGKGRPPRQPAAKAAPRRRAVAAAPAAAAAQVDLPANAHGARALIRAGLKALGEVRGDMLARQARVFELLLGIGQSPAWSAPPRAEPPPDPFGKFEDVFDQRVARALERLGMPSPAQLRTLTERVEALSAALHEAQPLPPRRR